MGSKGTYKYAKIMIIHHNKNEYFEKKMFQCGIQVVNAYMECNKFLRIIRRLCFKYRNPSRYVWFNKELNNLKYNTIIIFDSLINVDFIQWIKKNNPNKRIILWYWNPVRNSINPKLLNQDICEIWSYSLTDCKNYKLQYNTTFYFKKLYVPKKEPVYDIFFIGKDKGRLNQLIYLKKEFERLNLKTNFHITPTRSYMIRNNPIYKQNISYDNVLSEIGKSKAILDVLSNPNDGLSLRPMEAIFHKKKLITNSKLIENYDFYRPENIFILGKDDLNNLSKFINSPYEEIDEKIIEKYDFQNWLSRF